jgi:hypothetical protein
MVAWGLLVVVVLVVASHWTTAKTWWKYRGEIDQAAAVIEGLHGGGS